MRQSRVATGEGNVSSRDLGPTPGFGVMALNAAWKFNHRMQLSAGVDNLFDHTYSEHLNLAGSSDFGYPAEPSALGVEELTTTECWRLLEASRVGRIAIATAEGRPELFPVNFMLI